MEVSAIAGAIAVATTHSLGVANFILRRHCCNSFSVLCGSSSEPSSTTGLLSMSAGISAVVAPPAVRPNTYRSAPRTFTFTRQQRRTRRRPSTGDCEDGGEDGLFGDDGDGPFGGGRSGGSGGRGWNFDGYGGFDWEESSYPSSDPAFVFIYEVLCWIALSNCLHFAFKKLVRIVADGIGDPSRAKIPMRLVSM